MKLNASELLVIYLGASPTGGYMPGDGVDRLRKALPMHFREALATIAKYLDGPDYPLAEWTSNDLNEEAKIYEEILARAFPELDARAVDALACRWSYGWK